MKKHRTQVFHLVHNMNEKVGHEIKKCGRENYLEVAHHEYQIILKFC
jgi:hypothetical protein